MIGRRGFLKTIFGASLGAVTKGVGNVVEALTTRQVAQTTLNVVTASEVCHAKFFFLPYIPLLMPGPVSVKGTVYGEGRLDESF